MTITKNDHTLAVWALLRIGLGLIFVWAFFDKLFGLGFATCRDKAGEITTMCSQAWVNCGSPTTGFLKNAVTGPFADFYHNLAGNALVDWLFMIGLLVVGVGLTLGVWIRAAAAIGIIMLALMYSALLWPKNHLFLDEHLIYIITLFGVFGTAGQARWSLQGWWQDTIIAKKFPFLR